MNAKKLIGRSFLLFLMFMLSGCFFQVNSLYHYKYPIQSGGTIDLRLAPLEDLQNFSVTGFYPLEFGVVDVELYCVDDLVFVAPPGAFRRLVAEKKSANAAGGVFNIGVDLTSPAVYESCGASTLSMAIRIGDNWAPILSEDNLGCIGNKIYSEGENYLLATQECLALDPRETTNSLGLNPFGGQPNTLNDLTILLPQLYR